MDNISETSKPPLLDLIQLAEGQELSALLKTVPAELDNSSLDAESTMQLMRVYISKNNLNSKNPETLGAAVIAYATAASMLEPAQILIDDLDQVLTIAAVHPDQSVRKNARAALKLISRVGSNIDDEHSTRRTQGAVG